MDSSQTNPKVLISKTSSSSTPNHQESSLLNFLETLSPIGSVTETQYSQRYPLIDFPSPSPVFTSPRMDSKRQTNFFKSNSENDGKKQENNDLVSSLDKGKKLYESPVSIEKYFAYESSSAMKEINGIEDGDCDDGNVEGENTPHSDKQIDNHRLAQIIKSVSGALDDRNGFLNSLNKAELDEELVIQEGFNHQQNICRHLQFGDAMNHNDTYHEIRDTSNLQLTSNLRSSESLVHPLVESTESCVSSGLQCPLSLSIGSKEKQIHERRSQSLSNNFDIVSRRKSHFHGEDDQKENLAIVVAGSNTPQSAGSMHHGDDSSCVYGFKQLVATWENVQDSNIDKDLNQFSSKKDRKKAKFSGENEGCKRCNCKRSRCLKLYCDCFASGVYCVDGCACENCYNKPEFEDTVLDMRQKIENRNPLAFAPKVVKHPTKSPANTMEPNWATPSSARHKRGCNCKRSKCLKKYCECYQAGVGCSDGCRCEECSNSFGKKTELIYRSRANSLVTPNYLLPDITNLSPIPHPHAGVISSSASSASQVHINQGSNVHGLTGYLDNSPKMCGNKGLAELSSVSPDSFLFNIWKENVSPDILNNNSPSLSPNQKQQSSSRSPSGLITRRKFVLRNVSPFPPLTPFSSSKGGGMQENESSSQ